ncbi:MAG: hypothetical protein JXR84_13200, partial [Anaerolineae bacterium]|nr:hypothetical protein [Anaerolineae bacterium]
MSSANPASRWIICALSMVVVTLLALGCGGDPTATPTSGDLFDKPLDTPGAAVTLSPEERHSGEVPTASVTPVPTATAAPAPPSSTPPTTGPLIPGIVRVSVSSAGAQANGRSQLPSV